ncbi:MAG: hypothetical protein OXI75_01720, partial [Rhodospirillales bacterium]|nr:hypothetical protein [Rhodospirillales bacterium]
TQGVGQVTLVLGAVLILFVLVFHKGLLPSIGSLPGLWLDRAAIREQWVEFVQRLSFRPAPPRRRPRQGGRP